MWHNLIAKVFLASFAGCLLACGAEKPNTEIDRSKLKKLDAIPEDILIQSTFLGPFPIIGHPDLTWDPGVLTVAFQYGDDDVLELIERTAKQWTNLGGNLQFSFRNSDGTFRKWTQYDTESKADIRITFLDGDSGGYWSEIGNWALNIDPGSPTMNLENFDTELKPYLESDGPDWMKSYDRLVILHEFGHAVGLAHEHFHDDCQNDMNKDDIVEYLSPSMGPYVAKRNIDVQAYLKAMFDDEIISENPIKSPKIDRRSVMLYATIPPEYFKSKDKSKCLPLGAQGYATTLSEGDKQYYLSRYQH